jgi:hypothetical protein
MKYGHERLAELATKSSRRLLRRFTTLNCWRANCPMAPYCGDPEPILH